MSVEAEEIAADRAPSALRDQEPRRVHGPALPALLAGTSNPALAVAVAGALGQSLDGCAVERFPDGELQIALDEHVRGRDAYVIQATLPPVGENILELTLVADALHRVGAARVTAVIPYFGFARQERRARAGEALGAKVAADLVSCGRFARLVAIDLHAPSIEGFFDAPLEHLSAVPLLADAIRAHLREDSVIVSPDLGGAKLAREYARLLDRPVAVVHKTRLSGRRVEVHDVTGDVARRSCVVVDDLVATGGTIEAAVAALRGHGANDEIVVAASHALLAGDAVDVLSHARIARLVTTDTVPPRSGGRFERTTVSVAPVLADAIRRIAGERPASPPPPA